MVTKIESNGMCTCRCDLCGSTFRHGPIMTDEPFRTTFLSIANAAICDDCVVKKLAADERRKLAERKEVLETSLCDRMKMAGLPHRFICMDKPFVRETATWLWKNRHGSLLLAGGTGTGKTSSAVFIARVLMRESFLKVSYHTRQTLLAKYVKAKTDNEGDGETEFFREMGRLDILIVDEMVGKRGGGKMSPAAQELFFAIVDRVYTHETSTRVWFLGNFYKGAVDSMVDDPDPLKRRLVDSFALGWVEDGKVEQIAL